MKVFTAVVISFLLGCGRPASPLENKLWLSDVEWKAATGGDPALKHYADGTILQFLADGRFRLVECHLIGNAGDGKIGISRGDGYVRHNGTWKTAGASRVDIHYRVDTPTRLVSRPWVTGPWMDGSITIRKGSSLRLGSTEYRVTTGIEQESLDFILRD